MKKIIIALSLIFCTTLMFAEPNSINFKDFAKIETPMFVPTNTTVVISKEIKNQFSAIPFDFKSTKLNFEVLPLTDFKSRKSNCFLKINFLNLNKKNNFVAQEKTESWRFINYINFKSHKYFSITVLPIQNSNYFYSNFNSERNFSNLGYLSKPIPYLKN